MSNEVKNRTARNSIFIIRESLKELRYHASRMHEDEASIDRVIKEADLLSQTCKKLLNYVETPKTAGSERQSERIDINRLAQNLSIIRATIDQNDLPSPSNDGVPCGGSRGFLM